MIKQKAGPKTITYVIVTFVMAVVLSLVALALTKINIPKPEKSASTVSATPKITITPAPQTDTYKLLVGNELDKAATLSAEIKDSDSWFNVQLPAIDFKISF